MEAFKKSKHCYFFLELVACCLSILLGYAKWKMNFKIVLLVVSNIYLCSLFSVFHKQK